jgi:hypothetical protein
MLFRSQSLKTTVTKDFPTKEQMSTILWECVVVLTTLWREWKKKKRKKQSWVGGLAAACGGWHCFLLNCDSLSLRFRDLAGTRLEAPYQPVFTIPKMRGP